MKAVLFWILVLLMWIPSGLTFMGVKLSGEPLEGAAIDTLIPKLNKESYFESRFQDSINLWVNDNIAFRNYLVRYSNSFKYHVFSSTQAPGVVVGNDNYLFIESYIQNYLGLNYIGDSAIKSNALKIQKVQDKLKSLGTELIIVLSPGKASYFDEYIPDRYIKCRNSKTNYLEYRKEFKKQGVAYLDYAEYFRNHKNRFKYPVFPTYGTHWTQYASSLVTDSIMGFLQQKLGKDLVRIDNSEVKLSDSLIHPDYDVGVLLNLKSRLKDKQMPYPKFKFIESNKYRPEVLVLGDSYWWCVVGCDLPNSLFKQDVYWHYNKEVYIHNGLQEKGVADLNFIDEILKREVVMIMCTEATLALFPYGFIDKAYGMLCATKEERVNELILEINSNAEWLKGIKEKAAKNGVELSKQVYADAEYMHSEEQKKLEQRLGQQSNVNDAIQKIMEEIRNTPNWYSEIVKKAKINGISIEAQVRKDAEYMLSSEAK